MIVLWNPDAGDNYAELISWSKYKYGDSSEIVIHFCISEVTLLVRWSCVVQWSY